MIQKQKEIQISQLKAQINPHFLFNTLNSIYSLTLKKSDEAPKSILKLSSIMRYMIADSENDKVLLSKEIQYINDYIDLQKLRLGKTTQVITKIEGDFTTQKIAPLLLISLVENAFKYGVSEREVSTLYFSFTLQNNIFHFQTQNNIYTQNINSTKMGIKNTKERLNLLYENKYTLEIQNENKHFSVDLILHL